MANVRAWTAPADYPWPTWQRLPRWVQEQKNWWAKNQDAIGHLPTAPVWDDSDEFQAEMHRLHDEMQAALAADPLAGRRNWHDFSGDQVTRDVVEAWLYHLRCPACDMPSSAEFGSGVWSVECVDCDHSWAPEWVTPWGPKGTRPGRKYTQGQCMVCGRTNNRMNPVSPYTFICNSKIPDYIDMGHGWGNGYISLFGHRDANWDAYLSWQETTCSNKFWRGLKKGYYYFIEVHYNWCEKCGVLFTARLADQRFCDRQCGPMPERYALRLREQAMKASPTIRRIDVFERDNWTCHICCQLIDRDSEDKMQRASVDHVQPIALGGTHTLDNVAASHLSCNLAKSDNEWPKVELSGLRKIITMEATAERESVHVPSGLGADILEARIST